MLMMGEKPVTDSLRDGGWPTMMDHPTPHAGSEYRIRFRVRLSLHKSVEFKDRRKIPGETWEEDESPDSIGEPYCTAQPSFN